MDDYNEQNTDFHPTPEIFSGSPASTPRRGVSRSNGHITRLAPTPEASKLRKKLSNARTRRLAVVRALSDFATIPSVEKEPNFSVVKTPRRKAAKFPHPSTPLIPENITQEWVTSQHPEWRYLPDDQKLIYSAFRLQEENRYAPFTLNLSPVLIHRAERRATKTGKTLARSLHHIIHQDLKREFNRTIAFAFVLEVDEVDDQSGRIHLHGFLDLPTLNGTPSREDKAKARSAMHKANGNYATPEFKKRAVALHMARNGTFWTSRYIPKNINKTRQFIDERLIAQSRSITQAGRDCYESQVRILPPKPKRQVLQPRPTLRDIKQHSGALTASQGDEIASTATNDAKTSENGLKTLSAAPIKPNPTPKKADYFPDPLGRTKPPGLSDIEWLTHPNNPGRNKGITLSNDDDLDDFFAELDNVAASIPPD